MIILIIYLVGVVLSLVPCARYLTKIWGEDEPTSDDKFLIVMLAICAAMIWPVVLIGIGLYARVFPKKVVSLDKS